MNRVFFAAAMLAVVAVVPAHAQDTPLEPITLLSNTLDTGLKAEDVFVFEYGVPANPAVSLVGGSQAIPTTTSLQRFAFSVLGASESAEGGASYGLDIAPLWAFGQSRALADYERSGAEWSRRAMRTRISSAYSEGDSDKKTPSRAAVGLTVSMLDDSDAALQMASGDPDTPLYSQCMKAILTGPAQQAYAQKMSGLAARATLVQSATNSMSTEEKTRELARIEAEKQAARDSFSSTVNLVKQHEECTKKVTDQASHQRAWDVGAAVQWSGRPGSFEEFEPGGGSLWTSFRTRTMGGGKPGAATVRGAAHLRFDWDRHDVTKAGADTEYDRAIASVGVERLGQRLNISLQAAYERYEGSSAEFDGDAYRYIAQGDYQIADTVWLTGAVGVVEGRGISEDTYTTIGLKFKAPKTRSLFGG